MSNAQDESFEEGAGTFATANDDALSHAAEDARVVVVSARRSHSSLKPEWLRWRLPASRFPMWMFDQCTGAIVAANAAAVDAYGFTNTEFLERNVDDLCPPDRDSGAGLMGMLPRGRTITQRRKDGTTFDAHVTVIDTGDDAQEKTTMTMVLVHPAAPSRSKTLFGRAKVLPIRAPVGAEEEREAREHTERLERVLRCDASEFESFDARALADRLHARVRPRADAKDADVVIYCKCTRVWGHPEALAEALYELLRNAIQATRRGHPVIMDACDVGDGEVLWLVQDAGYGMSAETLAALGRAHHTEGRDGSTKLGVALAWSVIDKHGGLLRFESAPNVGTTASIWLPGRPAG